MTVKKKKPSPKPVVINVFDFAGRFAQNKDAAAEKRDQVIIPKLRAGKTIILDYEKVASTTQSFTHALISEAIRTFGAKDALNRVLFKNCNENVKRIIAIVVEYMQKRFEKDNKK